MSIDEIRAFRNAEPFQPFTLLLNSGRVVHVKYPLGIALAPDGRRVAFFDGPRFDILDVGQIRIAAAAEQSSSRQG